MLPGVAYLEMARAAVNQAAGLSANQSGLRLKNVVWASPITVTDHPVQIHIGLFLEDDGQISYEIYSESKEAKEAAKTEAKSEDKSDKK